MWWQEIAAIQPNNVPLCNKTRINYMYRHFNYQDFFFQIPEIILYFTIYNREVLRLRLRLIRLLRLLLLKDTFCLYIAQKRFFFFKKKTQKDFLLKI